MIFNVGPRQVKYHHKVISKNLLCKSKNEEIPIRSTTLFLVQTLCYVSNGLFSLKNAKRKFNIQDQDKQIQQERPSMQLYCRQPVVQTRTLEPILFLYIRHSIEPLVLFNSQYYFIWQLLILLHVHSPITITRTLPVYVHRRMYTGRVNNVNSPYFFLTL